jgi:hypothetical protein
MFVLGYCFGVDHHSFMHAFIHFCKFPLHCSNFDFLCLCCDLGYKLKQRKKEKSKRKRKIQEKEPYLNIYIYIYIYIESRKIVKKKEKKES